MRVLLLLPVLLGLLAQMVPGGLGSWTEIEAGRPAFVDVGTTLVPPEHEDEGRRDLPSALPERTAPVHRLAVRLLGITRMDRESGPPRSACPRTPVMRC